MGLMDNVVLRAIVRIIAEAICRAGLLLAATEKIHPTGTHMTSARFLFGERGATFSGVVLFLSTGGSKHQHATWRPRFHVKE